MIDIAEILQQIQDAVNVNGATIEVKDNDIVVTFPDGTVQVFEGAAHLMGSGATQYDDDMGDLIDLIDAQGVIPPVAMIFSVPDLENELSVFNRVVDEGDPGPEDCIIYIPPPPPCDLTFDFSEERDFNYIRVEVEHGGGRPLGIGIGTDSDDWINGSHHNDVIFGGDGDDYINGRNGSDWLYGEDGNDFLFGGNGQDFLFGGDGNDILIGGNGKDFLFGDDGDDILRGGRGPDELYGGDGDDCLFGGRGPDKLYGGDGNDRLAGGRGPDELYGEDGDDFLIVDRADLRGHHGAVDGGDGFDTVDLGNAGNYFGYNSFQNIRDVELLDMEDGEGDDHMFLNAYDVMDMTDDDNELFITGDKGDKLYLTGTFEEENSEFRGEEWVKSECDCDGTDGNVFDLYMLDGTMLYVDTDITVIQNEFIN